MSVSTFSKAAFFSAALAAATVVGLAPASGEDALTYDIVLKNGAFEPKELKVPAGKPVVLTVKNETNAAAEFESKGLKIEKVVAANSQIIVRLRPLTKGKYLFVDEYKEDTTQGYLIVE